MPTTKTQINDAKKAAVTCFDDRIRQARIAKNAASGGEAVKMTGVIDDLRAQREEIFLQDYVAGLQDEKMQAALAAIQAATTEMNDVADNMKKAAEFISKAASFIGAGAKVVSALKGAAG